MKEKVLTVLEKEIEQKHLPGAVIQVMHEGDIVLKEALGHREDTQDLKAPMQMDTVFDLSALTKVFATLPAILKLIDDGEVRLDDPVSFFLPDFTQHGKETVTLRHLLTHTSGLPAHRSFYEEKLNLKQILQHI